MAVVPSRSESLSDPAARLRLSSPAEVLAAVPYLIGFSPQRSVVVLSLRGKELGLTMRLDIDLATAELRELVIARLHGDHATKAVIVLYDPDPASGGRRPGAALSRSLIRAMRRDGLHVQDALGVHEGRFWSYLCTDRDCCPPGGRAVPVGGDADHSKVAATFVAAGTAPLADREELSSSIGFDQAKQAMLTPYFEQALERPAADPVGRWQVAVQRYCDGPRRPGGGLGPGEAARLIVSLRDAWVRDEVVSWAAGEAINGLLTLLRELAPQALPPYDAQLLATLAWAAYGCGDGAVAAVALERALSADPDHRLARLLMLALEAGVTPEQLRAISGELADLFGWQVSPDGR